MTQLSDKERRAWRERGAGLGDGPSLSREERHVSPNPEARARYIRFATQASRFYRGDRPVRFVGDNWKL